MFVTEFGTQTASGDGANNFTRSQQYLDLMAAKKISWTNWNYSDDSRSGAVFTPGTCPGGPFAGTSRLKPAGVWVRDRIRARRTTSRPTSLPTVGAAAPGPRTRGRRALAISASTPACWCHADPPRHRPRRRPDDALRAGDAAGLAGRRARRHHHHRPTRGPCAPATSPLPATRRPGRYPGRGRGRGLARSTGRSADPVLGRRTPLAGRNCPTPSSPPGAALDLWRGVSTPARRSSPSARTRILPCWRSSARRLIGPRAGGRHGRLGHAAGGRSAGLGSGDGLERPVGPPRRRDPVARAAAHPGPAAGDAQGPPSPGRPAPAARLRAAGRAARRARARPTPSNYGMSELGRAHTALPDDLLNFHYDPVACAVAVGLAGRRTGGDAPPGDPGQGGAASELRPVGTPGPGGRRHRRVGLRRGLARSHRGSPGGGAGAPKLSPARTLRSPARPADGRCESVCRPWRVARRSARNSQQNPSDPPNPDRWDRQSRCGVGVTCRVSGGYGGRSVRYRAGRPGSARDHPDPVVSPCPLHQGRLSWLISVICNVGTLVAAQHVAGGCAPVTRPAGSGGPSAPPRCSSGSATRSRPHRAATSPTW